MWFDKKPGDIVSEASQENGEPGTLLIGDAPPDWVRLPPELGSRQLKVLSSHQAACPKCKSAPPVRHLELADLYGVAECTHGCGFVWYRRRA